MKKIVAPRFSKRFRRLCQVAAIAGTQRAAQVVDGLLPVAMVYHSQPFREPTDWIDALEELFGLTLSETDVSSAISRAAETSRIVFHTFQRQYFLSREVQEITEARIRSGEDLERRAQASWLAEVETLVADLGSETLWSCLLSYSGNAFLAFGVDATELLDSSANSLLSVDGYETPDVLLKSAMSESGLEENRFADVSDAIHVFFDGKNPDRVAYINELANSTVSFMALGLDSDTRESLLGSVPELTIFVDTNVIYGLIGAHENPLTAVAPDLFVLLKDGEFPFKIYYHEKTLRELEHTLSIAGDRLRRFNFSPAMSRAVLNLPSRAMSSIEIRYHQLNAEISTSVDVFFGRYSYLPVLLAEYGLTLYREQEETTDQAQKRAELVAEYESYLYDKGFPRKPYTVLDHDVAIWLSASRRQVPRKKGPIYSGALVISADHIFRRFDRDVLSPEFGSGTWIVTRPDALLQALRLFTSSGEQSPEAFSRIFSTAEFRGIGRDHVEVANKVASYLAAYENISETTATKLLTNSLLMSRLKNVDETSSEFEHIIQEELVRDNETLLLEKETALEAIRSTRTEIASIRTEIVAGQVGEAGSNGLVDRIEQLERRLTEITGGKPEIRVGKVYMNSTSNDYSGGYYENTQSQVGAQGPRAKARDFSQSASQQQGGLDTAALAAELETLKQRLIKEAKSVAEYQAIAEVQAAKEAANDGDEAKAKGHLAKAGSWAFEVATRIGASLAAAALKQSLGIGP